MKTVRITEVGVYEDPDKVELDHAINRLKPLAERWERTSEWHHPPFLDGEIHITTGDLRDIATLIHGIDEQ
jgi:hypothetical protein